ARKQRRLDWGEGSSGLSQTGMFAQSPHGWVHGVPDEPSPQSSLRLAPRQIVRESCDAASHVHRVPLAQLEDLPAYALQQNFVLEVVEDVADPAGDLAGFLESEAAGGNSRRPEAQAAGDERGARIVRHGILVDSDVRTSQSGV